MDLEELVERDAVVEISERETTFLCFVDHEKAAIPLNSGPKLIWLGLGLGLSLGLVSSADSILPHVHHERNKDIWDRTSEDSQKSVLLNRLD